MARSFITAALAAALMTSTAVLAASAIPAPIAAAVADASRPAADKERDANRKPAETVAFVGVKPGMTVAELGPGGGYYTRILAKAVGPKGKVLAIVGNAQGAARLEAVVKDNPNVQVVTTTLPNIMLPEKADLFWTTENYHDFHNGPTANVPALDKAVYDNLKAGGIFYVEDHAAAKGAGAEATSKLHRMDEDIAKQELGLAGFKVVAEGDILKSATDDKTKSNSESGHFMTERFMLKLQRP